MKAVIAAVLLFAEVTVCQRNPECSLPPDSGPCDGACMRWHYAEEDHECRQFSWGCCGGNGNKFETATECYRACAAENVCHLASERGHCRGICPRWYYDGSDGVCKQFEWGCCAGNGNKFPNQETCREVCGPQLKLFAQ